MGSCLAPSSRRVVVFPWAFRIVPRRWVFPDRLIDRVAAQGQSKSHDFEDSLLDGYLSICPCTLEMLRALFILGHGPLNDNRNFSRAAWK